MTNVRERVNQIVIILGTLLFLKFDISVISQSNIDGSKVKTVSLLIWTTTPWSLVANKAICYKGDAEYSIVDTGNAGSRLYAACCVVATDMLSR